ncbi:MAG: histidine kinase [Natronomonas sp.]|uniref:histidine kinase n=1 Tax=Natronomonas sp. TaxID=2184060 RepID=UPI002870261A|nr:histidine kinase [Natronomonas sp.]MDR9380216.1 histidine kinase [Natronomonas sp.]MDR9429205.1 histidine kinase [Natronomonas sp.]
MSTQTETATATATETIPGNWKAGVAGGLGGGLVFGMLMTMMMPNILETAIPVMYGIEGPAGGVGWVIHMIHAAILGVVFAALLGGAGFAGASVQRQLGAGIAYGLVLWIVLATFVMPAWVGAMGPMTPPVPDVNPMSAVGHVVYGVILGGVYHALEGL